MRRYRLSGEADHDIEAIIRFTVELGASRAIRRGSTLRFRLAGSPPELGRRIDHIRSGYRRLEHGSHSVCYVTSDTDVTIIRVVHRDMLPEGLL